ncbi:unnamed protein product [Rhodiola kirilowii]
MEQEEDESPELPRKIRTRPRNTGLAWYQSGPSPIPTSEEHKERPVPRIETSKFSTALPFSSASPSTKIACHWTRMYLNCSAKVEINIPLLEAIKQIPRYAKFFKGALHQPKKELLRNDQELMS